MDLLDTLPNLSIAELRKVLSDNEIQESPGTESREGLLNQVSEVLLTNMMIKDTMENEKVVDEKTLPNSVKLVNLFGISMLISNPILAISSKTPKMT